MQGRLLYRDLVLVTAVAALTAGLVFFVVRAVTAAADAAVAVRQDEELLDKTRGLGIGLARLRSEQAEYGLQALLGLSPVDDEASSRAAFLREADGVRVAVNSLLAGTLSAAERRDLEELHAHLLAFRKTDAQLVRALRLADPSERQRATAAALGASAQEHQAMAAALSRVLTGRQHLGARGDSAAIREVRARVIQAALFTGGLVVVLLLSWLSAVGRQAGLRGKLEHLSSVDELTGLANRKAWNERLAAELARSIRQAATLSVLLLELDHFKDFGRRQGHGAADTLLVAAGQALKSALRRDDFIARPGGCEFAFILPACDAAQAVAMADRLRVLMPSGQPFSAGIASWDRRENADHLMERVRQALRQAKSEGGNRSVTSPGAQ